MLKRVHLTALAFGVFCATAAHAQLVIDESAPRPVVHAPAPALQVKAPKPVSAPSGLVIVDGYDQPPASSMVSQTTLIHPSDKASPKVLAKEDDHAKSISVALPVHKISGHLTEKGPRPKDLPPLKGWGNGVPLAVALPQIIPHDYSLISEAGSMGARPISWSAHDRVWPRVLGELAQNEGLDVTIDWTARTVSVRRALPAPVLPVKPQVAASSVSSQHASVTPSVEVAPVVNPAPVIMPAVQTWRLDPQKSLRENVVAWAKQAGWNKVVWDGADYPIYAPASFTGTFDAPDGPLAQLINGFADSDQPLLVRLTLQDKVIHIINKNYTPTEVESVPASALAPRSFSLDGNGGVGGYVPPVAASKASDGASSGAVQAGSHMAPLRIDDRTTRAAHH